MNAWNGQGSRMIRLDALSTRRECLLCRIKVVFTTNPFCWVEAVIYGLFWGFMVSPLVVMSTISETSDYRRPLFFAGLIVGCVLFAILFAPYAVFRARRRLEFLKECLTGGRLTVCKVFSVSPTMALPEFPTKALTIAALRELDTGTVFEYRYHCPEPPNLKIGDRVLFCCHPNSNEPVFVRSVFLCLLSDNRRQEIEKLLSTCQNGSLKDVGFEKITVSA
jgi:hypothetical protein